MAPLTFGIEFEFAIATLPELAHDPEPYDYRQVYDISDNATVELSLLNDNREMNKAVRAHVKRRLQMDIVQRHIAETMTSAGFSAITDADNRKQIEGAKMNGQDLPQYQSWHVSTDGSITIPGELCIASDEFMPGIIEYEWYKIELISPAFVFSQKDIKQVKKVCKLIHQKYRTLTNKSCGLHIHVGQGFDGLPDDAIKSLMATIWTFEDRLDLLHPLHRIDGNACNSLYNSAPLAKATDVNGNPEVLRQQLDSILHCTTGDQVIEMVNARCPKYGLAYNVWNLRSEFASTKKRTIEFRQHEGTLDARRVENWIKVCVGLVEFARRIYPEYLKDFLRFAIDYEEYSVENLLVKIGLPKQAKFYGRSFGKFPRS